MQTVLRAAVGFMKTKVITSEMDTLGIVLYNTSESSNAMKFAQIKVLLPIDEPNAETIKKLEALERTCNDDFKPAEGSTPISEVLWTC